MLGKGLGTKQTGCTHHGPQKEQGTKLARQKMTDWACFLPRGSEGPALGDGLSVSSKCLANHFSSSISSHPPATHLLQETGSCSGTPLPSTSPWDLVG